MTGPDRAGRGRRLWHDRPVAHPGDSATPGDSAAGPDSAAGAGGPFRRVPVGGAQLAGAGVGVALAVLALPGAAPLLVGLLALQVLLGAAVLAVLGTPGRGGALVVVGAAAATGAVLAGTGDGRVDALAGVAALALVASLLHQLSRRTGRTQVTASLAGTLLAVVLVLSAACLGALRAGEGSRAVTVAALLAVAVALPALQVRRSSNPALGLLLAPGAGAVVAGVVALVAGTRVGAALLLGLAAGVAVVLADRALTAATAELGEPRTGRRTAALRPLSVLLPYALLGPAGLLLGRLAGA